MEVGSRVGEDEARAFLYGLGAARATLGGQLLVAADVAGWLLRPPEARLTRPDRVDSLASEAEDRGEDFDETRYATAKVEHYVPAPA